MKKTISMVSVFILTLTLAACGESTAGNDIVEKEKTKSTIEEIKDRGKLRIAVFSDKPPFGYIDENGENQGYDILLGKRIAKDLLGDESKVEFVLTEAQSRVDVLKAGKVDITLANFTVTPERAEQVDFANPYMKVSIGVVSPKSGEITSTDQLKDKKLLVNKGTTAEAYFTKNHPEIEQVKYDQNTEAFESLKDGRGAALAHDNTLLFAWGKENPDFTIGIKEIGELDFIAPAVKKGNKELLNWLNDELEKLGKENFFHDAYEKTLKPTFGDDVKAKDIVVTGVKEK